jgi:FAD-dependent urate hydroxylase
MLATNATASVLITDARERAVVGAIRALDAAGYRVATTGDARLSPGAWSRSCSEHHRVSSPSEDGEAFVGQLEAIVQDGDYAALVIGSDASLLAISEHRERLERHVRIVLPSRDAVRAALSKVELARAAEAVGFGTPRTRLCESREQARHAARELGFPVIAKSASTLVARGEATVRPDSRLIADEPALGAWLEQPGPWLIQHRERGEVYSCAGVMADEGLVGFALARYLRTWPPQAGNASFAETVAPPRDLRESVSALLDLMAWRGIFELELMSSADGGFVAIDLNPRVYGSLALSVRAGASLPALWCDVLLGRSVLPRLARPGLCYRWEEGEARNLAALARRGAWRAALAVLRPRRGCTHAEFSIRDPGPIAARALLTARKTLARSGGERASGGTRGFRRASAATAGPTPTNRSEQQMPQAHSRANGAGGSAHPVAIVGAGPYGLAVGAHLRDAGVAVRQFGRTMSYWREQMPSEMLLRSSLKASSISDPNRALRLERYAEESGRPVGRPIELSRFVEYGEWFQHITAPDLDERSVARVERNGDGFTLTLEDDEQLRASRVVVAAGLFPFARRPPVFDALPPTSVSHASEYADLSVFSGASVAVIGCGQSALESAALLSEHGAKVEVLARAEEVYWLGWNPNGDVPARLRWPKPPTDVGGRVTGWIASTPGGFRLIPSARAKEIVQFRCLRPAGAGWLRPRLTEVTLSLGRTVLAAEQTGEQVVLTLDDGTQRNVDHVFLGTGYDVDVRRYPFLAAELSGELELSDGLPILRPGLESSIPGLHFVGAPATGSFGPIMRFVVGTWYAAPAVTRRVLGQRQPLLSQSY